MSNKSVGSDNERALAKRLGGKRQPLSGALASISGMSFFAGDVTVEDYMIEAKLRNHTNKNNEKIVKVEKKWIDKIKKEAFPTDKIPCVSYRCKHSRTYFMVIEDGVFDKDALSLFNEEVKFFDEKYANKKSFSAKEVDLLRELNDNVIMKFSFKGSDVIYYVMTDVIFHRYFIGGS